jgi:hypothetical protein
MLLMELQNFLNDLMTDSPHRCRERSAPTPSDNPGGSRLPKKRSFENLVVEANKRLQRGVGSGLGRGRGRGGPIVEAVFDLFQTLAILISTLSLEF